MLFWARTVVAAAFKNSAGQVQIMTWLLMRCHHHYHTQIVSSKTRKRLTTEIMKTTAKTEPVTIPTTSSLPLSRSCEPDDEFPLDGNELFHWSSTHQHSSIYWLSLPQRCGTSIAELAQRQQCNFLSGAQWWMKKYVRHWLGPVLRVSFSTDCWVTGGTTGL